MVREVVEGTSLSLDLRTGRDPFPYPQEFQWTRNSDVLSNSSQALWGYPGVALRDVSRTDSGLYSLSATNYRLDNPSEEIGRSTGSFQLNVLCKLMNSQMSASKPLVLIW